MRADLHIHTTASDGTWTPGQVIAQVQAEAIRLFAVTDHDTIDSVPSVEARIPGSGLRFLRGVEVSATLDGRLFHVLVYGFTDQATGLADLLAENRARMERYNLEIVQAVAEAGYAVDVGAYDTYAHVPGRGGWKSLNFLVDQGVCTGLRDYFDNLMAGLSLFPPVFCHPAQVVSVARSAGGVPILAHPGASVHQGVTAEALAPFLEAGIAGVECYHSLHDGPTTRFCLDWCRSHDLLITGGSDCHGGFAGRELGKPQVDTADLRLGELEGRIAC